MEVSEKDFKDMIRVVKSVQSELKRIKAQGEELEWAGKFEVLKKLNISDTELKALRADPTWAVTWRKKKNSNKIQYYWPSVLEYEKTIEYEVFTPLKQVI